MTLAVARVAARDLADFLDVGLRLQRGAGGAPQPRADLARALDPRRSPVARDNAVALFVARRDGRPVGRIAAVRSPAHLARHRDGAGQFGLLDCADDREAVAALAGAAASALAAQGLSAMRGPFNLGINHESGLLVEGFDAPHTVRTNFAPPHMAGHLDALGFRKAMDLLASACPVAATDFPERHARAAAADPLTSRIRTRGLTHLGWRREFPAVLALFNDAWADNWGAVPVSEDEGRFIAALTRPVARPSWIRLAEVDGAPIAVVAQVPDVNEPLRRTSGRLLPFGWARVLDAAHRRGTRTTRLAMVGVARRWRGTPTGRLAIRLLLAEAIRQARAAGAAEAEISWMLETNRAVLALAAEIGARPTKRWRVYERPIGP